MNLQDVLRTFNQGGDYNYDFSNEKETTRLTVDNDQSSGLAFG